VLDRRAAPPSLCITLLGRVAVRTRTGGDVRLSGRHAHALLTILALTRRPRTREAIAADLWPDTVIAATGPLRQALYQLRAALLAAGLDPESVLESDSETLGLRPEAVHTLDVASFEACTVDPRCFAETAIQLYAGDLAEGLAHDCFAAERERLADRYEDALATVAAARLEAGDHDGARQAAERLLLRDPLREEAHAVLIAVYGRDGTRSQVVRQYRRLCAVLARELDESPLPETDATYRAALLRTVERSREVAATLEPVTSRVLVAVAR
jgi:DNA-binding SARP family transcriptional activator